MPGWLALSVNGQERDRVVLVNRLPDGAVVLPADLIRSLGMRGDVLPYVETTEGGGYRVAPPLSAQVDEATQTLALAIPPSAYPATIIDYREDYRGDTANIASGLYLDYDLLGESVEGERRWQGFFEPFASGSWGVATNSLIVDRDGGDTSAERVETWWEREHPETMTTLRLGDATSRQVPWGSALRFGGVQLRRDFGTRPLFNMRPTPTFRGETALPSVVDVYVDNVRRQRLEVPPGAFEISNLPLPNVDGTVDLVVTDLLGRQQIVSAPYLAGHDLLRPGLTDYAMQAGWRREAFGRESDRYGAPFTSGYLRRGVTDAWTLGGAAEADQAVRGLGATSTTRLGRLGSLGLAAAVSDGDSGRGGYIESRYRGQSGRLNYGFSAEWRSPGFRSVAENMDNDRRRNLFQAVLGADLGRFGSVTASALERRGYGGADLRQATLAHRSALPGGFALSVAVTRSETDRAEYAAALSLTRSFGARASLSLGTVERREGLSRRYASVSGSKEGDASRLGYRVSAISERSKRLDARADLLVPHTHLAMRTVAQEGRRQAYRGGLRGSVGVFDGKAYMGRRMGAAGAVVVDAGDAGNTDVLLENRVVARTDSAGRAVVVGLRPYQANRVALNGAQIPVTVSVASLEADAAPPRRRAARLTLAATAGVNVLATLLDPDGVPLPAGTQVIAEGGQGSFPVGRDGKAFFDLGATPSGRLVVDGPSIQCTYAVPPAGAVEPFTHLGVLPCETP